MHTKDVLPSDLLCPVVYVSSANSTSLQITSFLCNNFLSHIKRTECPQNYRVVIDSFFLFLFFSPKLWIVAVKFVSRFHRSIFSYKSIFWYHCNSEKWSSRKSSNKAFIATFITSLMILERMCLFKNPNCMMARIRKNCQ